MSFDSTSTILNESSSEVVYSSLDSCNSISNCHKELSLSDPYMFPDADVSFINKLNTDVYGQPKTDNTIPLPNISTIKLAEIIKHLLMDKNRKNRSIIHLIMNYFYPIKFMNVYFVSLDGSVSSSMQSLQLLMYSDDSVLNLQKNIALSFNVSCDYLILCEFWKSILTKLKYEKISMISSTDQIIAYYMPTYIAIKNELFDTFQNTQLSYTSLIHQCHNFIDDNEQSLSSLHFGLYNYPYFEKSPKTKTIQTKRKSTLSTDETISELSSNMCQTQHFIIPPPIDENDCISSMFKHNSERNKNSDVVNVGIPIPLMLPKHTSIATEIITKQCEMILLPYLKQWKNTQIKPYELYVLSKSTVYCGICSNDAFCNGCPLSKYKEIPTNDLDFVISIRWIDEDAFNTFDQNVFTLNCK